MLRRENMKTDQLIFALAHDARVSRLPAPSLRFAQWLVMSVALVGGMVFFRGVRSDIGLAVTDLHFVFECFLAFVTAIASGAAAFALTVPGEERRRWARFAPPFATA